MNPRWIVNRLRAMGPAEIAFRLWRAAQVSIERALPPATAPPPGNGCGSPWLPQLPKDFAPERYVAAAERILAGRFDLFALRDAPLGFPPCWNRDPKTGTQAPLIFGKSLDYRSAESVGDIKYVWELSRHHELVALAQAWHLTREVRYAIACRTLLESWFDQCPYPLGVHWTSSLEHAIRLANWSFAWHLLQGNDCPVFSGTEGLQFRARWLASVYLHCKFIAGLLSRHSSANNHLLGELTGLFIGATTWPAWPASRKWQDFAQRELEREALKQTADDGVNREQATWYHHSVADMMLLAGLIGHANQREFSGQFWRRLESMLEFIASIMDVGGNVPNFGDADDGVMVRFVPDKSVNVFGSLVATGAVLFGRADLKAKAHSYDDKTRWLLGDAGAAAFAALPPAPAALPIRRQFEQGGYFILGGEFETDREVRIVADAGPLGYLALAAHGHADALSFLMSVGGRQFLVDAGTYAYHTEKKWRDYFRGTSAHNTVRIDGVDQSVSGGNFLWLAHATTTLGRFEAGRERDTLIATTLGYERLPDPVRHRRLLTYQHATNALEVEDQIECRGTHTVEVFWHVSSHWSLSPNRDVILASDARWTIEIHCPAGLVLQVVHGADEPPLGWTSRGLDHKEPCATLVLTGAVTGTTAFVTRFRVRSSAQVH